MIEHADRDGKGFVTAEEQGLKTAEVCKPVQGLDPAVLGQLLVLQISAGLLRVDG